MLGPIVVYYSRYRRTGAFRCKRALKKTLKRLGAAKQTKQAEKKRLASKLARLNGQMLDEMVRRALEKLPISEVTDARGIGERGASRLAQHGFRTVADLRSRVAAVRVINGFGDYRMTRLSAWLSGTEHRLRERAQTDPQFEPDTRRRYRKRMESLQCRIADLEGDCVALGKGIETVQRELQRYQQVSFVSYLRDRLSVKRGGLNLPAEIPAGLDRTRASGRIETKALPEPLLESVRFQATLRQHLRTNFQDMTPRDFEEFIARLLERLGYSDVQLTSPTQDMGADIECTDEDGRSTIVEVKRYGAGNKVSNRQVRALVGAQSYFDAERALFVTTSNYTPDARRQVGYSESIELWSRQDLERKVHEAFFGQDPFAELVTVLESWASSDVLFRLEEVDTGSPALLCDEGLILVRDEDMIQCPWVAGISVARGLDSVKLEWPDLNTVTLRTVNPNEVADIVQERSAIHKERLRKEFRERVKRIDQEFGDDYLWSSCGVTDAGIFPIRLYEDRIAWVDDNGTHALMLRDVTFAAPSDDNAIAVGSAERTVTLPAVDPQTAAEWLTVSAVRKRIAWAESNGQEARGQVPWWGLTAAGIGALSCGASIVIAGMLMGGSESPQGTSPAVTALATTPTATLTPTDAPTPVPSNTPEPTDTPVPTADISDCTLGALFQADVTAPDDTRIQVGRTFTKTWRIRNTGTCDWAIGYCLAYVDGDRMNGPDSVAVPQTAAGESSDIAVVLVAPSKPGRYRGYWQLCVNETEFFGDRVFVQIVAFQPTPTPTATSTPLSTPTPKPTLEPTATPVPMSTETLEPTGTVTPAPPQSAT